MSRKRHHFCRPHALNSALAVMFSACSGTAAAGQVILADNSQVLQSWQRSTGAASTPQLVEQSDGGTTIQWQGGVTLDVYSNRSSGGNLTTPVGNGDFYKLQAQGDLRSTSQDGSVSYLQFSATHTDDKAALSHAPGGQINTLQMGRAGPGYLLALGDVSASFSSLGANTGLRGLMAQKQFGTATLSATAGVVAESWEALAETIDRTAYLRQVVATKLEGQVSDNTKVYATAQGFEDDEGSLPDGVSTLAPASGRSATAGFAYQSGSFGLQGEAGLSRWQEDGQERRNGQAFILDATWSFDKAGLRAGYHDMGKYYSSLSAQGGNGVREAYVNGNWTAADWLNMSADLRHSENKLAATPPVTIPPTPPTVNAAKTDALALTEMVTFGPDHPAWSLVLSQSVSNGENGDESTNRNQNLGATVAYAEQGWNGSVGYNQARIRNDGATSTDGRTDVWSLGLGRMWMGETWNVGLNFAGSVQDQKLDSGSGPRTVSGQIGLSTQRIGWGSLTASCLRGKTRQNGTGDLVQRGWQIDATHPFEGGNAVKLYYRDQRVSGSDATPSADYSQRSAGMQLVYVF